MFFSRTRNLGIDLGNTNTLVGDQNHLLLSEPSVLVVDNENNQIEAVGEKAYKMLEKVHSHLRPIRPLKGGVISDAESAKKMVRELVRKVSRPSLLTGFKYVISGVPFDTTPVEKRALRDTLEQFNASHIHLVHEPIAAAIGMGLNIQEPEGKLIVDIGGGITEVVVISLSGVASFQSIRIAGDDLDTEIQDYFRKTHHLAIGIKTAEEVKKRIGCVYKPIANSTERVEVKGKDIREGIPASRWIHQVELCQVLEKRFLQIESCIHQSLEMCPPELAGDIYQNGLYITGGNARLKGLQERFTHSFGLPVHIDPHSLLSVSKGVGHILSKPTQFKGVLI
jgi:rod shape-determining protein MreB